MYKEHYSFKAPESTLTIWRYIDFTKFVDLLLTSQLFFTRSDNFDDPFEGVFKLKDYKETKDMLSHQHATKKFYFLNCWHINENQSDAMWKIFLNTKNGIAIKSSVERLITSLEVAKEDIFVNRVHYRDFEKVTFDELLFADENKTFGGRGSSLNQFKYKRISFEHEKELRLYFVDLPIPHTMKNGVPREPLTHKRVDINLNALIDEVVVNPFADSWFRELVEKVSNRLDFKFKVTKSDLYELGEW
ncbi:MAG: hypothetical protein OJF59_002832 [Cytophagales bacterium]|jgi:hypothetical protein|nr:DUF2971 domain-containing protein [Bacteroidota bacterium]WHZ06333.1 MAG: hypothetical protein OJF59_000086 [Cytophagales bacterium]WHZ09077.1 MAG: hypothetical protein OJF59_002832 [Cytophagales bacterium]